MSVTFSIETTVDEFDQAPATVTCECPTARVLSFPTARLAYAWCDMRNARPFPLDGCTDPICQDYSLYPHVQVIGADQELNVAGGNAAHLLRTLGILPSESDSDPLALDLDLSGAMDAEDFLGRVLLAQALYPADAGRPALTVPGPGAQVIDWGRSEGYTDNRLACLRTLADVAVTHRRRITWA